MCLTARLLFSSIILYQYRLPRSYIKNAKIKSHSILEISLKMHDVKILKVDVQVTNVNRKCFKIQAFFANRLEKMETLKKFRREDETNEVNNHIDNVGLTLRNSSLTANI